VGFQLRFGAFALQVKFPENLQVFMAADSLAVGVGPDFLITDRPERQFGGFGVVPEIGGLG